MLINSTISSNKANPAAVPAKFAKRYFEVPRREIAYLRFILESYDGLAFMRTVDRPGGVVEIAFPHERLADAEALLAALRAETAMRQIPPPREIPPL